MKKIAIGLVFLVFLVFNTNAQSLDIKAIPYAMHFENTPLNYKVLTDNEISITAPENSDLFISPDGGYKTDKSPRLLFSPDSDFILTAKIKLDFNSNWDAGVLMVFNDNQHFAKFCFESDFKGQPRVVSVVCNTTADDCNSMTIEKGEVYYRITGSTKSNVFNFYYSADGKSWFPIRTFKLDKADNIAIGFSAQSPSGKKCMVNFSEIELQQRKPADFWKGN